MSAGGENTVAAFDHGVFEGFDFNALALTHGQWQLVNLQLTTVQCDAFRPQFILFFGVDHGRPIEDGRVCGADLVFED